MQWEQNYISSSSSSWLRHKTQETIARKNKIANNTLLVIYLFILFIYFIYLFIYFIYFFICLFLWLFIYLLLFLFLLFFFSSAIKIMPSPGVEPGLPKPQSGVLPLYYKGLHIYRCWLDIMVDKVHLWNDKGWKGIL